MEATATTVTLQTDPRLESYVAQLFHTNKQKRVIFELDPDPALEQVDKYLVFNKARQLMACPYAPVGAPPPPVLLVPFSRMTVKVKFAVQK